MRKGSNYYTPVPCVDCGKERYIKFIGGKPDRLRCHSCANRITSSLRLGELNPNYRGSEIIVQGYVMVDCPNHPKSNGGKVKRAVLVLEQKLGRPIRDGYDSHHINEIKTDDRPENLEEKLHSTHVGGHFYKHGRYVGEQKKRRAQTT